MLVLIVCLECLLFWEGDYGYFSFSLKVTGAWECCWRLVLLYLFSRLFFGVFWFDFFFFVPYMARKCYVVFIFVIVKLYFVCSFSLYWVLLLRLYIFFLCFISILRWLLYRTFVWRQYPFWRQSWYFAIPAIFFLFRGVLWIFLLFFFFIVFSCLLQSFSTFQLNILCRLFYVGKCLSISFVNIFPSLVFTFLLHRRLNWLLSQFLLAFFCLYISFSGNQLIFVLFCCLLWFYWKWFHLIVR